eukprot:3797968-Karenia_brevis.AAC.1
MKAPVSIALWRSRELPRNAGSPQLVETSAGSYGADINWVKCILFSTMYSDFNILTQRPQHWGPIIRGSTVLGTDQPEVKDPLCTTISDSKGLFDALNNELP